MLVLTLGCLRTNCVLANEYNAEHYKQNLPIGCKFHSTQVLYIKWLKQFHSTGCLQQAPHTTNWERFSLERNTVNELPDSTLQPWNSIPLSCQLTLRLGLSLDSRSFSFTSEPLRCEGKRHSVVYDQMLQQGTPRCTNKHAQVFPTLTPPGVEFVCVCVLCK